VSSSTERLRFDLLGRDVSASRTLRDVARAADEADRELDQISVSRVLDAQLRALREQLDALGRDITAQVRVQIVGDDVSRLRADLDRATRDVTTRVRVEVVGDDLTRLRALLDNAARTATARVRVELDVDWGDLADLRTALDWFDGRRVTVSLRLTGATQASRQLADLSRDLMWFDSRDRITVGIDVDINDIHEVELLNELLDRLDHDRTVNIRVDSSGASAAARDADDGGRLAALGDRARSATASVTGLATSLGLLAGKAAVGVTAVAQVGQFVAQLGPAAAIAAPALLTMAQGLGTVKLVGDEASKQLEKFKPQLDQIKASAEKAFAPGFSQALKTFSSNFPVVEEGVRRTAGALGWLANEAASVFSGPAFRADLGRIMNENATAVWRLGDAGVSLAGAFWDVTVAAQPVWQNLTSLIQVSAKHVALWVEAKRESGDLGRAISESAQNVGDFVTALYNFAVGAHSILGTLTSDSTNLSASLLNVSTSFRTWATSEETLNRINTALAAIRETASEVFTALAVGFVTGAPVDSGWLGVVEHLGANLRELADFVQLDVLPTLAALADLVTGPFGQAMLSIADVIHGVVLEALSTLLQIVRDDLVPLFGEHVAPILRDYVVPAFQALGDLLRDHVFPAISEIASAVADHLGPGLDYLKTKLDENKPQLEALGTAAATVAGVIVDVLAWAIEHNLIAQIDAAILVIGAIITVIGDLVNAALQMAVTILNVAADAITGFKAMFDAAATTVKGILDVWGLLPGPLGEPFRQASREVDTFKSNVDSQLDAAAGKARDTATSINDWLGGIHDKTVTITIQERRELSYYSSTSPNAPGLTYYASGGTPRAGEWSVVGEDGPELVHWQSPARVYDSQTSARMARSGGSGGAWGWDGGAAPVQVVNVYMTVQGSITGERDFVERIAPKVRNAIANDAGSNARDTGLPTGRRR